jgi:hypothetical protein
VARAEVRSQIIRFGALLIFGWRPMVDMGGAHAERTVKGLMLYVVLLVAGAALAAAISFYVQSLTSAGASLIVFLSLFFSNFAVSWIATIFLIDGSLKNAWGEQEQLEAERRGKAFMNGRA